jgi:hypothetical protein
MVPSTDGKLSVGTKVLAMEVAGNSSTNEACCTTSGVGTSSPTYAMIHQMA